MLTRQFSRTLLLASIITLTGSTAAIAQPVTSGTLAPIPPMSPGQIAPLPGSQQDAVQPADEQVTGPGAIPEGQEVEVTQDTFKANSIEVSGNTLLTKEELDAITGPYIGRELTPNDLTSIVNQINKKYQEKGYLTSIAYVPPQDFQSGVIKVDILEGSIGNIAVTGNKYFRTFVVSRQIKEKPGDPLNLGELEKELQRLNRTQPFKLKADLSPGEGTGQTDVLLHVKEQQPFQVSLFADNLGRPYIGTNRGGVELTDRNVFGLGDRLTTRVALASGTQIVGAGYSIPLNKHGTELSALFSFNRVDVDLDQRNQPEIIGKAYNYGLYVSQPLDKERVWVADLGFNARRITNYFDGDETRRDDIRSLTTGLNFDKFDRYGRTLARTQFTVAPEWLGANVDFWKGEGWLTRLVRVNQLPGLNKLKLSNNHLLILRGYGQFTTSDLPPAEQYQLGGMYSVRGYSEGLLFGDRGFNVSAEYRYPIPFLRYASPWLADRLQGAVFFDYGHSWLDKNSDNFIVGVSNRNTSLMSVGVGVRAHLTDRLQGYADFGYGLFARSNIEPNAQPTVRLHFGVRSDLLSNAYKERTQKITPIKTQTAAPKKSAMLYTPTLDSQIGDLKQDSSQY